MIKNTEKPFFRKFNDTDWEFVYPESLQDETLSDTFWNAVDLLDYNDKVAEEVFKKIITRYPYHIDAYNYLSIAFRNQNKGLESLLCAGKAYEIGKSCMPGEFFKKRNKMSWSWLENRPFLRSCQIYAMECAIHKEYDKAIELFKENLSWNEGDNQGIRYLLLETYLKVKDYEQADKLVKKYREEHSIEFTFGAVALAVLNDNIRLADKLLQTAVKTNQYFVAEVSKSRHVKPPPHRIPGEPFFDAGIPTRSIQESYDYWNRNKELYKNKKIIEYFKDKG
ncbi:MAG: hypothetical protein BGO31_11000 [Bacteroidetes bacterium 43-16]|uniref:tetratricopeptide repeat protein n=1 Tax=uncultured Dysgonomonas sp. TaxID=206096 RepID=UPI00092A4B6B|nr:tetratricopeptide repeat protein [uncultured Dysgonomonas sp.]OJV50987.1 MAG: hypothetical protein BGO31_11000 [Bacteroidetes bacterium 43-16]